MNESEAQAYRYLSSLGFAQIVYEPLGNVSPDFLLDGRVAVEVRRLNYHYVGSDGLWEGVETAQSALLRSMRRVLSDFGKTSTGRSWIVRYWFQRPLPPYRKLMQTVREAVASVRSEATTSREIHISSNFTLYLNEISASFADRFVLGGYVDRNTGGWQSSQVQKNVKIAIEEKAKAFARLRSRYSECWLLLVDHIAFGEKETLSLQHTWDKVILINPLNPEIGYEV